MNNKFIHYKNLAVEPSIKEPFDNIPLNMLLIILQELDFTILEGFRCQFHGHDVQCLSAEQDRILFRAYFQVAEDEQLFCYLYDESLLENQETIETANLAMRDYPIYSTVTKNYAAEVIEYIYMTGKVPRESLWSKELPEKVIGD